MAKSIILAALVAGSAMAQTVLVDFSNAATPASPAGDGKYWNTIGDNSNGAEDATVANLIDASNVPTGIGLTIDVTNTSSGGISGAGFGGSGINGPSGADPFDEAAVVTDGVFCNNDNNGTAVFAFTGLVPGGACDFSAIGGRASGGVDGQIIILDSATPIGSGSVGARGNYQLLNDGTILNFSVDATAGGEIWLEFRGQTGNNSDNATINGLSIVPEVIDTDPPTLASDAITDDASGGLVEVGTRVTYTLTFSEDINEDTVSSADFNNAGTSEIDYGLITETSPGVFAVEIIPTTPGTLQLRVPVTATILDLAGNSLDSDPAIADDTTLTVRERQPNIVIFLVDDMGVHDTSVPFLLNGAGQPISYNFNSFYQTPNMETLAATGMRFTTAYAQTVCSPTRVGLLTGRTSARHGVTDWVGANDPGSPTNWRIDGITESEPTLPKQLQAAGYRTIHVGKGHFAKSPVDINNLGFDVNIAGSEHGEPGSYTGDYGQNSSRPVPHLEAYRNTGTFLTKALTLEANSAVENAVSSNMPFFLHMSFFALHTPFTTNPDATGDYSSAVSVNHTKYATMVEGVDLAVGDIRQKLVDLGVAEDTLILFLGDNGTDSPATTQDGLPSGSFSDWPMRGKKASKWEGGARVPLIATWAVPDAGNTLQQALPIPANSIEADIVTTWDIPVTLLDFVGLPVPAGFGEDSHSLLPYLAGTPGTHRPQEIAVHYPHEHRSEFFSWIRQGELKLIYNFQSNTHELYDLASDPTESNNLAASQPEAAMALARRLAQMLDAEWGQAGILLPTISSTAPAGNVVSIPDSADIDLDNDGIDDRDEDPNRNGLVDPGETDPDNDNTPDGAEL